MARLIDYGSGTTYRHRAEDGGEHGYSEITKHSLAALANGDPNYRVVDVMNRGLPMMTIAQIVIMFGNDMELFDGQRGRTIARVMSCSYDHVVRNGNRITSWVQYQANLGRLTQIAERKGVILQFIEAPPLDNTNGPKVVIGPGVKEVYDDDDRLEGGGITQRHAYDNGHTWISTRAALGGKAIAAAGYMSFDGYHTNGLGHVVIADQGWTPLMNELSKPNPNYPAA